MTFKEFLTETRLSDSEYRNLNSPWRLTLTEYLKDSNKEEKYHPSDAYETREHKVVIRENPPEKETIKVYVDPNRGGNYRQVEWIDSKGQKRIYSGIESFLVGNPDGSIERAYDWILSDKSRSGDISDIKIAYNYYFQIDDYSYKKENIPYKIKTIDGIEYRLKKSDNKYDSILVAFDGDYPIGIASYEYGAYLVMVDPKYRSRGIGSRLAQIYYSMYKLPSGGYTIKGEGMASKLHQNAVNDAERLGWYDRALNDLNPKLRLSQDKIDEIKNSTKR